MRRWNGWGDVSIEYHLHSPALRYLRQALGEGTIYPDAGLPEVITAIPASQLPSHPMISQDPMDRLLHSRGQSLPDWIAMRSGRPGPITDGVAYPQTTERVRELVNLGVRSGWRIIPYGGGTSVVGHINPTPGSAPVLTIDLSRLNRLLDLDPISCLAVFEAGVRGPDLEAQLRSSGYTLGHYPQSFEYSTLGGWIATRSSGQQSHFYGRIEDMFAGGYVVTPAGDIEIKPLPASAAGPDLRHLILGSEGRLGIVTRAVVRIRLQPQHEQFPAFFLEDWETGMEAVRTLAQSGLSFSMVRLSDPVETETSLALSLDDRALGWVQSGLGLIGYRDQRCMLLAGLTGTDTSSNRFWMEQRHLRSLIRKFRGLFTGRNIGRTWSKSRFKTPYLRNTLWESGYALDTLETAVPWIRIPEMAKDVLEALRNGLRDMDEPVLAFAHISHVYMDGASLYFTYIFRKSRNPEETMMRWKQLKHAASQKIIDLGGTISHQHGIGTDHIPYMTPEKSLAGIELLNTVLRKNDPGNNLNPGKLLPTNLQDDHNVDEVFAR